MKTMLDRAEYIRSMQAKLDEWNADIVALTVRADAAEAGPVERNSEQIESLKLKLEVAWEKIEQSKTCTAARERD